MIVPTRRQQEAGTDHQRVERRRNHRDAQAPEDWERIALQRVAGHVKSLTSQGATASEPTVDGGWEEVVLRTLRRRVQELEPKK